MEPSDYIALSQIPRWRQVLSNFSDDCEIKYGGLRYRTIEHVFQAMKISMVDPVAAQQFALESDSHLSKGLGEDAQKQRKMHKLSKGQLASWDNHQKRLLKELWAYKAMHCPLFCNVLIRMNKAQLWHVQNRKPAIRWKDLEVVRQMLSEQRKLI
eukprot:jgi/Astpho2/5751/fgenesh1_pg.00080_%23_20_t